MFRKVKKEEIEIIQNALDSLDIPRSIQMLDEAILFIEKGKIKGFYSLSEDKDTLYHFFIFPKYRNYKNGIIMWNKCKKELNECFSTACFLKDEYLVKLLIIKNGYIDHYYIDNRIVLFLHKGR